MIRALPTFRQLVAHFPDHDHFPTPALLDSIGERCGRGFATATTRALSV